MSTSTTSPVPATSSTGCAGTDMPAPLKQHAWLQRFAGEWDALVETYMEPGQPPMQMKGVTRARILGGFWLLEEGRNLEMPYEFVLTLGYDAAQSRYVGTWVDSMVGYLWRYQGSVDSTGNILTLDTEGPNPMDEGRIGKVREVTEFKSNDLRVLTSSRVNPDGSLTRFMTVTLHRKV